MNLQNLIDYCQEFDLPSPFVNFSVPAPLNRETALNAIMVRCGLLTPIYLEPEVFTNLVTQWSAQKQWTFEHLINVIHAEYSPIENYDRHEKSETLTGEKGNRSNVKTGGYTDTDTRKLAIKNGKEDIEHSGTDTTAHSGTDTEAHTGTDTTAHSGTDTEAHTGTDTEAHSGTDTTAHSGTDSTTNTISAFNTSGFQNDSKSDLLHGESIGLTHGESIGTTHGESISTTHGESIGLTHGEKIGRTFCEDRENSGSIARVYNSETDTENTGKTGNERIKSWIHGNIGVTTNQQMIEQELELLRHFDVYGYIAELFERDNMIMVY